MARRWLVATMIASGVVLAEPLRRREPPDDGVGRAPSTSAGEVTLAIRPRVTPPPTTPPPRTPPIVAVTPPQGALPEPASTASSLAAPRDQAISLPVQRLVALRIVVTDERGEHPDGGGAPLVWSRGGGSWYPDLRGGGDLRDVRGFRPGADTLLVFPRGRDEPPLVVPLVVDSAGCAAGCARDPTEILLRDWEVEVGGAAVAGGARRWTRADERRADPPGVAIGRRAMGPTWPLAVDAGWLDCVSGNRVVFRTRTRRYALNPPARAAGYDDVAPIVRGDTRGLVARGAWLCGSGTVPR